MHGGGQRRDGGPDMVQTRRLGRSDLEITPIGLGCWQFAQGQGMGGIYWEPVPQDAIDQIVAASLAGGITWFDTAKVYGNGASERALARALRAAGKANGEVVVATKWWPILRWAGSIKSTIGERLSCLDGFGIDLYQVHQPFGLSSVAAEMNAMADLAAEGKIRTVGVSNFNAARMRAAHAALAARGLPLVSNQMRYSLLDRRIERNGVLAAAKELGVTVIAYSPLGQGVLTGKFHDDPRLIKTRRGPRKLMAGFRAKGLEKSWPLIEELKKIASAHGATASQVALAWLVTVHGDTVVAIPGASRVGHVQDNVGAMHLTLSERETRRLDELSQRFR